MILPPRIGSGVVQFPARVQILKEETSPLSNSNNSSDDDRDHSLNCIQEDEDDDGEGGEETRGIVGGESLSQQLDLRGLSQELTGVSQETLVWADAQMSSQGGGTIVPSVTPAGSATHSQEDSIPPLPPAMFDANAVQPTSAPSFFNDSQASTKGLECLLQAADQVSAEEGIAASKRRLEQHSTAEQAAANSARRKRRGIKQENSGDGGPRKKVKTETGKGTKPVASKKKSTKETGASAAAAATRKDEPLLSSLRSSKRKIHGEEEDAPGPLDKKKKAKANITTGATGPSSTHQKPDNDLAQEAADLAARVIHEEHLGKQLLLSMVMERQPTRTPPETLPKAGHEMPSSFVWSHYPPLEKVLRAHMEEYYHLSLQKRQSAAQQAFNNELVQVVRKVARDDWGWTIPSLDDKALRDRIRCYYKTHIQNAKKRLATMLKNPRKVANARHLVHHLHLIKQTLEHPKPAPAKKNKKKASSSSSSSKKKKPSRTTTNEDDDDDDGEDEDASSCCSSDSSSPKSGTEAFSPSSAKKQKHGGSMPNPEKRANTAKPTNEDEFHNNDEDAHDEEGPRMTVVL